VLSSSDLTAVAIVPPEEVWSPLQIIRRKYDRQLARWMPHIPVLHPFCLQDELPDCIVKLRQLCTPLYPFALRLRTFQPFVDSAGTWGIALEAEPQKWLTELHAALRPGFPPTSVAFSPRLCVGQMESHEAAIRIAGELQQRWRPITFLLHCISLMSRSEDKPFAVVARIPLGEGDKTGLASSE